MGKMFFGGVPTGVDVSKLRAAFDGRAEGTEILHEEVEEVLDLRRAQNRYRTVTDAWRRQREMDDNVRIQALDDGRGFRIATAQQRIEESVARAKEGTRKVVRAARRSAAVQTADPVLAKKSEILQRLAQVMAREASDAMRQIAVSPKVVELNPRRGPQQSAGGALETS